MSNSLDPNDPAIVPEPVYTPPVIPLHGFLGLELEPAGDGPPIGEASVTMRIEPDTIGANGNPHGGAIATMVDVSCALAAVRASAFDPQTQSLVTTDLHVRYLGKPRTDSVSSKARVVRAGSTLIVVSAEVADSNGHLVAVADASMMIVALRRPAPT